MERANNDDTYHNLLGNEDISGSSASLTRPVQLSNEGESPQTSSWADSDVPNTELPDQGEGRSVDDERLLNDQTLAEKTEDGGSTSGGGEKDIESRGSRRWLWVFLVGIFVLVLVASGSAFAGYQSGIQQRDNVQATQIADEIQHQYELGLQDVEARRYDIARQRFEYVIRNDPNYPGVIEQLALVLLELNTVATLTPVPTPMATETPDTRNAEELFMQAQMHLFDKQWEQAIRTLLNLRKEDPEFHAVKVDGMLYVALRNLGVQKILHDADLEGGTYDLALAEAFGPIDIEARNYTTWANLYVTGASFWDLNWREAVFYFGQLSQIAPNLRDATNITATERFRLATLNYAEFLITNGEWCLAQEQFQILLALGSNPAVEPTATWAAEQCEQSLQEPETPTPEPTDDDENGQTAEPDVTPTPDSNQEPTSTPTP